MILPLVYNLRNVAVRKLSSGLTFFVVGVVVLVLAVLLSFADGIGASLAVSGSQDNLLILAPGATSESTSIITNQEAARLIQSPGVRRGPEGEPLISLEISVQSSIPRLGSEGKLANVAIRGVDPVAYHVHHGLVVSQGRRPEPGALELIVGVKAAERYRGLKLGDRIALGRLKNREFEIVGQFQAGGSALESEIWGPRTALGDAFARNVLSSALIGVEPGTAQSAMDYINGPAVNLSAKPESEYYGELTSKSRQIVAMALVLVGIMAVGAVFAVANTMYAAVDGRRREIAMLRTLGFRPVAIIVSFLLESLMICIPACAFGLAASMLVSGRKYDYLSDTTFTVLAYELNVTPRVALAAFALSAIVAAAGALAPAIRGSRAPLLEALRKA